MVTAVVLAAGRGERLRSRASKPLVRLAGKPLIWHSLAVLSASRLIQSIIVVASPENRRPLQRLAAKYGFRKVQSVVIGGQRRQDSVKNALECLPEHTTLVLVHDSARPFIHPQVLKQLVHTAQRSCAAIPAVPVKATVKETAVCAGRTIVRQTLDRSRLWEVQTPQAFQRELLCEAYRRFHRQNVTDDSALVEKLGVAVQVVKGSYAQIKVTTPEDLVLAEAIAGSPRTFGL